jgi:DNA-binding NtrC family response regulator
MARKNPSRSGSAAKSVLVVDDEIDSLREVIEYFKENSWTVSTAIDEKEAILEMERVAPSLVLLDLVLEKECGFEVLTQIKKTNPDTRVVIISKYFDNELITQAMKAGAVGFIQKATTDQLPDGFKNLLKGATA